MKKLSRPCRADNPITCHVHGILQGRGARISTSIVQEQISKLPIDLTERFDAIEKMKNEVAGAGPQAMHAIEQLMQLPDKYPDAESYTYIPLAQGGIGDNYWKVNYEIKNALETPINAIIAVDHEAIAQTYDSSRPNMKATVVKGAANLSAAVTKDIPITRTILATAAAVVEFGYNLDDNSRRNKAVDASKELNTAVKNLSQNVTGWENKLYKTQNEVRDLKEKLDNIQEELTNSKITEIQFSLKVITALDDFDPRIIRTQRIINETSTEEKKKRINNALEASMLDGNEDYLLLAEKYSNEDVEILKLYANPKKYLGLNDSDERKNNLISVNMIRRDEIIAEHALKDKARVEEAEIKLRHLVNDGLVSDKSQTGAKKVPDHGPNIHRSFRLTDYGTRVMKIFGEIK